MTKEVKKIIIEDSWKEILKDEFNKEYFKDLSIFIKDEYIKNKVYPHPKNIFNAFNTCPFNKVKVVIIGQDPYHGQGQANGLCFAVNENIPIPPSLKNIFKEIENDIRIITNKNGDLTRWAKQGVLLLNATLTVKANLPCSHQNKGWEEFTDSIIKAISEKREKIVFLLWGNYAKKKGTVIDRGKHLVLEAQHPSPFSAYNGFFDCKHFSKTNKYLKENNLTEIDWK